MTTQQPPAPGALAQPAGPGPVIPPRPAYPPAVAPDALRPVPDWIDEILAARARPAPDTDTDRPADSPDTGADSETDSPDKDADTDNGADTEPDNEADNGASTSADTVPDTDADADKKPDNDADTGSDTDGGSADRPAGPAASQRPPSAGGRTWRRWRWLAFNATAAGAGYWGGLVSTFAGGLAVAEQSATGILGTVLAGGCGWCAWRLTAHEAVQTVFGSRPAFRLALTVGAAEFGRRLATPAVAWLAEQGAVLWLSPADVTLLITLTGLCGGLWWLIDRHTRTWWWPGRLLLRIPLASALLAAALPNAAL
ncbi:hypothetical protein [Streptomyces sp. NPDC056987]|uniref:hypothetical protein n=1 Tax=Streptomyces sp. NPDC056987 TaxID=3345988 RepID=UPI003642820D